MSMQREKNQFHGTSAQENRRRFLRTFVQNLAPEIPKFKNYYLVGDLFNKNINCLIGLTNSNRLNQLNN